MVQDCVLCCPFSYPHCPPPTHAIVITVVARTTYSSADLIKPKVSPLWPSHEAKQSASINWASGGRFYQSEIFKKCWSRFKWLTAVSSSGSKGPMQQNIVSRVFPASVLQCVGTEVRNMLTLEEKLTGESVLMISKYISAQYCRYCRYCQLGVALLIFCYPVLVCNCTRSKKQMLDRLLHLTLIRSSTRHMGAACLTIMSLYDLNDFLPDFTCIFPMGKTGE